MTHVDEDSAPVLLMHSDSDRVVPHKQSTRLLEAYQRLGVTAELVTIPNAPHAFWNFATWFDDAMGQAARFFETHLNAD